MNLFALGELVNYLLFGVRCPKIHSMSKIEYNSLLNQISKILEETKKDFKEGSNRFVLDSNWEIGKKITRLESGSGIS